MIKTQENCKLAHFGPDLCPLGPNSGCHHVKYQQKLINQSSQNLVMDGRKDGQTDGRE